MQTISPIQNAFGALLPPRRFGEKSEGFVFSLGGKGFPLGDLEKSPRVLPFPSEGRASSSEIWRKVRGFCLFPRRGGPPARRFGEKSEGFAFSLGGEGLPLGDLEKSPRVR